MLGLYYIKDAANNTSGNAPATTIDVDTTAPGAPTVSVSPEGVVTVTPAAGDSTEVSVDYIDEAGIAQTITATKDPVTGEWGSDDLPEGGSIDPTTGVVTIPTKAVDTSKDVTATAKDEAGNTADTTVAGDTTAPIAPTNAGVVTDNVKNDGSGDVLDPAEVIANNGITNDNTPSLTIPADQIEAGGTPQLVVDNVVVPSTAVTNSDGSVTLTPKTPLDDGTHELSYNIKDAANNTSGNAPATTIDVDTTAPGAGGTQVAPVVAIEEAENGVNADEFLDGIQVQVTLPSGTVEGDTITLTVTPAVGKPVVVTRTVTEPEATAGAAEVTIPNDAEAGITADGDYSVVATVTDVAGNSSKASEPVKFTVDTVAPEIGTAEIVIDINKDSNITAAELKPVTDVTIELGKGVEVGDIVTLTSSTNQSISSIEITQPMIEAGFVTFEGIEVPQTQGADFKVTASISDKAGNIGNSTSDSAVINAPVAPETKDKTIILFEDGTTTAGNLNRPEVTITEAQLNGRGQKDVELWVWDKDTASYIGDAAQPSYSYINDDGSITYIPKTALDNGRYELIIKEAGSTADDPDLASVGKVDAVVVNVGYSFTAADFAYEDDNRDDITAIRIKTLPEDSKGTLFLKGDAVTAETDIAIDQISNLKFVPVKDASSIDDTSAFTSFQFSVVNDATYKPESANKTITVVVKPVADGTYTEFTDTTLTDSEVFDALATQLELQGIARHNQDAGLDLNNTAEYRNNFNFSEPLKKDYVAGAIDTTRFGQTSQLVTTAVLTSTEAEGYQAIKFDGLIYLEKGKPYNFGENPAGKIGIDDTLVVKLGGHIVYEKNDFDATIGDRNNPLSSETFTPSESGFYTLDMYYLNKAGAGKLPVTLNGEPLNTDKFLMFADKATANEAIKNSSLGDGFRLGSLQDSPDGANGRYVIEGLNSGEAGTWIKITDLSKLATNTVDPDERLVEEAAETKLEIGGLPAGYAIRDNKGNGYTFTSESDTIDITGWNRNMLEIFAPLSAKSGREGISIITTSADNKDTFQSQTNLFINISKDSSNYSGTSGSDEIILGAADCLDVGCSNPGTGDNVLFGGGGDDKLDGGAGNDVIFGDSAGGVRSGGFEYWDFSGPGWESFKGVSDKSQSYKIAYGIGNGSGENPQALNMGAWNVGGKHNAKYERQSPYDFRKVDFNNVEFNNPKKRGYTNADGGAWIIDMEADDNNQLDIWQNVSTMPGEHYKIEIVVSNSGDSSVNVLWDNHTAAFLEVGSQKMTGFNGVNVTSNTTDLPNGYTRYLIEVAGNRDGEFTELRITGNSRSGSNNEGRALVSVDVIADADAGDDFLIGGIGNDILYGQGGDDILWGGREDGEGIAGSDTFVYSFAKDNGNDIIKDFDIKTDRLYLTDVSDAYTGLGKLTSGNNILNTSNKYSATDHDGKHMTRYPGMDGDDNEYSTSSSDDNLTIRDLTYADGDGSDRMAIGQNKQYLTVENDDGSVKIFFGSNNVKDAYGSVLLEDVLYGHNDNDPNTYGSIADLLGGNGHRQILSVTTDGFYIPQDNDYTYLTNIDVPIII